MKKLAKKLQDFGLNLNEAQVYIALLELGDTGVARLAQKTGIKRTTVYLVLKNLEEKGLVSKGIMRKKRFFYAEDPAVLETLAEQKLENIKSIVPVLQDMIKFGNVKPQFRFYEGKKALENLMWETLELRNSEIHIWFTSHFNDVLTEEFADKYIKERLRKKIYRRTLSPDNAEMRKDAEKKNKLLGEIRIFSLPEDMQTNTVVVLYQNKKVAFFDFDEVFAVSIESEAIYQTHKNWFDIMWENAKIL